MTMEQNAQRIAAAKESIRQAIKAKGVNVDQAALIGTYPDKIAEISQDTPNIITFERYTERINTRKKIINGSGWQSIVSTNVFIEDTLPIDSRLHNTVLLMTTQFKANKDITFTADNLRVIIDLEWLDSNNNVIKSDLNLETNFKMARKVDGVDIYDTVTSTLKRGYFYSAMFGLRIHEIPGWSGVPAGATQLKLKELKTELVYSGALYLESGAGTLCAVLSNEGHEDPPTPPQPVLKRMYLCVKIGNNYHNVLNQIGTGTVQQSTPDTVFLMYNDNMEFLSISSTTTQQAQPIMLYYDPSKPVQGYIQLSNFLTLETIGSYGAPYYTYPLTIDFENNRMYITA